MPNLNCTLNPSPASSVKIQRQPTITRGKRPPCKFLSKPRIKEKSTVMGGWGGGRALFVLF